MATGLTIQFINLPLVGRGNNIAVMFEDLLHTEIGPVGEVLGYFECPVPVDIDQVGDSLDQVVNQLIHFQHRVYVWPS